MRCQIRILQPNRINPCRDMPHIVRKIRMTIHVGKCVKTALRKQKEPTEVKGFGRLPNKVSETWLSNVPGKSGSFAESPGPSGSPSAAR